MSGTCEAKRDVSKQSKGNHNIQNKQQCQWLSACLGNQREVSRGVAVMWKVVGGVGAGGGYRWWVQVVGTVWVFVQYSSEKSHVVICSQPKICAEAKCL
jgi:hypothetical protein